MEGGIPLTEEGEPRSTIEDLGTRCGHLTERGWEPVEEAEECERQDHTELHRPAEPVERTAEGPEED